MAQSLVQKVKRQMEFYLGDSNMRIDKFLQQKAEEDPLGEGWMDLGMFEGFNRVKQLKATADNIREAVAHSKLLVLSDDGQRVRRVNPVHMPGDLDERTLYIENFPEGLEHDDIKKAFKIYGKVALVSMPRYTDTRKFKGFAFVEFTSREAVERAVQDSKLEGLGFTVCSKLEWLARKKDKEVPKGGNEAHNTDGMRHSIALVRGLRNHSSSSLSSLVELLAIIDDLTALLSTAEELLRDRVEESSAGKGGQVLLVKYRTPLGCMRTIHHYQEEERLVLEGARLSIEGLKSKDEEDRAIEAFVKAKATDLLHSEPISLPPRPSSPSHKKASNSDRTQQTAATRGAKGGKHIKYASESEEDESMKDEKTEGGRRPMDTNVVSKHRNKEDEASSRKQRKKQRVG